MYVLVCTSTIQVYIYSGNLRHACTHTLMYAHTHARKRVCTHACTQACMHVCRPTHSYTGTHACTHTHKHMHTCPLHTNTHTHTWVCQKVVHPVSEEGSARCNSEIISRVDSSSRVRHIDRQYFIATIVKDTNETSGTWSCNLSKAGMW